MEKWGWIREVAETMCENLKTEGEWKKVRMQIYSGKIKVWWISMLWPKLVMSGVWSILCHFHCGRKMNHLAEGLHYKCKWWCCYINLCEDSIPKLFKQSIRVALPPAVQWPAHGTVMKKEGGKHQPEIIPIIKVSIPDFLPGRIAVTY